MPKRKRTNIDKAREMRWKHKMTTESAATEDKHVNEEEESKKRQRALEKSAKASYARQIRTEKLREQKKKRREAALKRVEARKKSRENPKPIDDIEEEATTSMEKENGDENENDTYLEISKEAKAEETMDEAYERESMNDNYNSDDNPQVKALKEINQKLLERQRILKNENKALKQRMKLMEERETRTKKAMEKKLKRQETKTQEALKRSAELQQQE